MSKKVTAVIRKEAEVDPKKPQRSLAALQANGPFQLTAEGYGKYLPRIKALRTVA